MMKRHILAGLVMVMMSIGLVACSEGPGDAVLSFSNAVNDGDYDEAVEYLPPQIRGMIEKEKLEQMMRAAKMQIEEKGGLESVEILEENVDGNKATVKTKTTFGNGTSETEEIEMVYMDDRWVMSGDGLHESK